MVMDPAKGAASIVSSAGGHGAPHRPLDILTIVNSFGPGGVERVALRLNGEWRRMGMTAHVLTGRDNDPGDGAATGVDYQVIRGDSWVSRILRPLWLVGVLSAIIRRRRPDLLFCPGNTYSFIFVLLKIALGRDCPPIIAKISNDLHRHDMPPVIRFFYHRWCWLQGLFIDHFVAIAPAMADEIEQRIKIPRDRIAVVNDPVLSNAELLEFARPRTEVRSGGRRFIAVGRLAPQKNFALLLDAFARIAHPDDSLTILGEGPERDALTRQAAALGISAQVAMPGHVGDVRARLNNADIFCMSSIFEGIPAVVIEAIAAQLWVVSTDCSAGMADLTGSGRFGTLVPVGDAVAFAEAMDSAPLSRGISTEAIEHVRGFTLEAGASAYIALGRVLLAQRAAR